MDDLAQRMAADLAAIEKTCMPFGKFGPKFHAPNGVPIYDLPAEYLMWFANKAGFPKGRLGELLTPIDRGDVCINVDAAWYEQKGLAAPSTLADLVDPAYRDQLVVTSPVTSSPGLAFHFDVGKVLSKVWVDGADQAERVLTAARLRKPQPNSSSKADNRAA